MNFINNTDGMLVSSHDTDISGITFILMCHLYSVVLEWLQTDSNLTIFHDSVVYGNNT